MRWLFVRRLRSFVLLAAAASFVLNIALLMPAIYMLQVFDRVFTSNSVETLLMLGLITLLFLVLGFFIDTVRTRALAWAGRSLDRKLAPAAIRSSLQEAAAGRKAVIVTIICDGADKYLSEHFWDAQD